MNRVLLNGLLLQGQFSGVQYYIENLMKGIFDIAKNRNLDISFLSSQNYEKNLRGLSEVKTIFPPIDTTKRVKRIFFEHLLLPRFLREKDFQLLHSPGYILPFSGLTPSIVTIHDLIALDHPGLCQAESALYFKSFLPLSVWNATKIIAVSRTVKTSILNRFDISPDKIEVIYHGIHERFFQKNDHAIAQKVKLKYRLFDSYLLFVGNIEPKKNIEGIIKAFYKLKTNTTLKQKLVIAGKRGWKFQTVFKLVDNLRLKNEILFTGYVEEEDLPSVYSLADIFLFPSLDEGFGIPALEAMACGVPVMISNKGALPEITGGLCLQVNPYNIDDIARGIYRLLTDNTLRNCQIEQGKNWAKNFSWHKSSEQTLKVYEEVLTGKNHLKNNRNED